MSSDASRRRPFLLLAPRSASAVLLTCEHATNRLPFRSRIGPAERRVLATHWGWDIGGWALTRAVAHRLGAGGIGGRWSRLLIDLNRRVDDPTLVRREAGGVELSWNRGLTPLELERRVLAYHMPYHQEVDRLIVRRLARGVRPVLLAVHTFTDCYEGRMRRFDAGVLYERDAGLARSFAAELRGGGLAVRYNEPYSGRAGMMYAVDRHASHHRLACLELEINQRLVSTAAGVARLTPLVAAATARLSPGLRWRAVTAAKTDREKQRKKPTTNPSV
jgi:predicted N-formylglutamate amidohydrolase